jgi:hypothetical protein
MKWAARSVTTQFLRQEKRLIMTLDEQNIYLSAEYAEAIRYMDNAKEALQKAGKQDEGYYNDAKYVRTACGIAYLGVLIALDAWLTIKGVQLPNKRKHMTIDFYLSNVAKTDKKVLSRLNAAYNVLHLDGYYRKVTSVKTIESGFDAAYDIIDKIKPENPVEIPETRGNKAKRAWSNLLISVAATFMGNRF